MAQVREAPMRMDTEDPWALTELAKAGGPGGAALSNVTSTVITMHLLIQYTQLYITTVYSGNNVHGNP